ncbi:AMP-binding protein [Methylocaldum sp.]|uniref:AMP-binding protein n=1 Tax=Methylocaldum sp. TaxID=1969727 RepID=UPI002D63180E|nr:AMP-binding protein [Methylocaldum sp.]HYE34359.1 AMP-binding protein [Methylocaldum sp.]
MAIETLQQFIRQLAGYGGKPAIVAFLKGRTETWSFGKLARSAHRLGIGLSEAELRPGDLVGLFAPNSPEWVMACLAVIEAGMVPVLIDAQMGEEDLRHVLADSEIRWLFTTQRQLARLERIDPQRDLHPILLDGKPDDAHHWQRYGSDAEKTFATVAPEDTSVLFYTSGTTGPPKGVPLSHRNLASNIEAQLDLHLIGEEDRFLVPLPLHHVYAFTVGMVTPFAAGVPIIFPLSLTGPELLRALKEGKATFLVGVPGMYEALFGAIEAQVRQHGRLADRLFHLGLDLATALRRHSEVGIGRRLFAPLHRQFGPELRMMLSGGAMLAPDLAFKLVGLGFDVATGYGLTETSPLLSFNLPDRGRLDTAGTPLPGVEVRIAEPEPPAEQGEVLAKGPNVFSGYRNLPDKTREAFTPDGFFRTGDLGYFDDGYLRLAGRASEMIVLPGGENIRPEHIEEILSQGPHIKEVGVLEKGGRLVALVVPAPAATREGGDLEALIRRDIEAQSGQLPSHHRLGDYAITPDPLPRTHLGKLRRHELDKIYEQAKQKGKAAAQEVGPLPIERMAPEDQQVLEEPTARQIWQWLAERFPNVRLTPDANLQLDLGVDSLEWLTLTLEMSAATGVDLDEETISRVQTVRDLLREGSEAGGGMAGEVKDPLARLSQPETLLDADQLRWIEPPGTWSSALGVLLFGFDRWLMDRAFQVEAEGLEHLPANGPFVLTPNHVSYLDPMAIAAVLPREQLQRTRWAGYTGVMFRNALMRQASRSTGTLPIDPLRGPLASLALGVLALRRGDNLVWFAESGRSESGELRSFESGIGLLLRAARVPAVPVRISGSYVALPVGSWVPRFRPIKVRFGPPATADKLEQEGRGERPEQRIAAALHDRVAQLKSD